MSKRTRPLLSSYKADYNKLEGQKSSKRCTKKPFGYCRRCLLWSHFFLKEIIHESRTVRTSLAYNGSAVLHHRLRPSSKCRTNSCRPSTFAVISAPLCASFSLTLLIDKALASLRSAQCSSAHSLSLESMCA